MKRLLWLIAALVCVARSASAQQGLQAYVVTGTGAQARIVLTGSAIVLHQLTWNVTGTVSSCTVALDTSADGVSWSAGNAIAGQTCTSNGQSSLSASAPFNFVRVNVTAFSGTGSVVVTWSGYVASPNGVVPSGTTVSGSDITFPGCINTPNWKCVNSFAGANLGAKINACFTALVSTGGICDARGTSGATISTQVNFPQIGTPPISVLLGPGNTNVTAEINIGNCAGCSLIGLGSGNTATSATTTLTWTGSSGGSPMILVTGNRNRVESMNLKGNLVNVPSAGIQIDTTVTNDGTYNLFTDLQIGDFALGGPQFTTGFLISGPNSAGSNNMLNHLEIQRATTCFSDTNQQAESTTIIDSAFSYCAVGLHDLASVGGILGYNLTFGGNTTSDLELDGAAAISIHGFVSQSSARLAQLAAGATTPSLLITGGGYGTGLLNADGNFVDFGTVNSGSYLSLEDFTLVKTGAIEPKILQVHAGSAMTQFLRLVNTRGIYPSNLSLGTLVWTNDQRTVIYEPAIENGQDSIPFQTLNFDYTKAADQSFQSWRYDFPGKVNIFGGEFRVNQLAIPVNCAVTVVGTSGATTYAYRVSALTYLGETTACTEVTTGTGNAVLGGGNYNRISWNPVLGARGYNVYGRTSGAEQLLFTVTWDQLHAFIKAANVLATGPPTVKDDGTFTPSGALPATNTTGLATVEGQITSTVATGTAPLVVTSTTPVANLSLSGGAGTTVKTASYSTNTNCSSSASPAVCGSAAAGSVAVPTGVTPTLVVNTTAVTANSQILFTPDESLGTKLSVTCNSTIAQVAIEPIVTARTAATSFTIQYNTTITVNPICLSYWIVN